MWYHVSLTDLGVAPTLMPGGHELRRPCVATSIAACIVAMSLGRTPQALYVYQTRGTPHKIKWGEYDHLATGEARFYKPVKAKLVRTFTKEEAWVFWPWVDEASGIQHQLRGKDLQQFIALKVKAFKRYLKDN